MVLLITHGIIDINLGRRNLILRQFLGVCRNEELHSLIPLQYNNISITRASKISKNLQGLAFQNFSQPLL